MKKYFTIPNAFTALTITLVIFQFKSSNAVIQCSDVLKDLIPCVGYLTGSSGTPSTNCCNGVKSLQSATSTAGDRKAACTCIMSVVSKVSPNVTSAQALPGSCGVTLPFTVSPNLDCSKIT